MPPPRNGLVADDGQRRTVGAHRSGHGKGLLQPKTPSSWPNLEDGEQVRTLPTGYTVS